MGWNDCEKNRRGVAVSVIFLGVAVSIVLMGYMVFGDNNDEQGLRSLEMVSIIFRHGDRSPTNLYPNDPHINYEWPGGLGALSEKGALQMYNLGKNLRMRYYRLISPNGLYSANDMYVLSTAAERCIMSAESLLAGFMPPLENRSPLPIKWQPIPVNSIPRDRDTILAQTKECPTYEEILQKLYSNPPPELKALNEKNADLYKYLTKHTGKNITTVLDVELLYNTLDIERNAGLELPAWTESIFPERMLPLAERNYVLMTETPLMKKIKAGPILTQLYQNMVKKRGGILKPNRKIFLYSAHDVTLVNIMHSLDILSQTSRKPEFGSAFAIELHSSIVFDEDYEVKLVYYTNSEDKFPKEINIPNCSSPCSLNKFGESIQHLMLDDLEEICGLV